MCQGAPGACWCVRANIGTRFLRSRDRAGPTRNRADTSPFREVVIRLQPDAPILPRRCHLPVARGFAVASFPTPPFLGCCSAGRFRLAPRNSGCRWWRTGLSFSGCTSRAQTVRLISRNFNAQQSFGKCRVPNSRSRIIQSGKNQNSSVVSRESKIQLGGCNPSHRRGFLPICTHSLHGGGVDVGRIAAAAKFARNHCHLDCIFIYFYVSERFLWENEQAFHFCIRPACDIRVRPSSLRRLPRAFLLKSIPYPVGTTCCA